MDAFEAAARHLAVFDPLAALRFVALSEEPRALMLRGIAMAQLGEFSDALRLLALAERRGAASLLGARCLAAQGEILLAQRELVRAEAVLVRGESARRRSGPRQCAFRAAPAGSAPSSPR